MFEGYKTNDSHSTPDPRPCYRSQRHHASQPHFWYFHDRLGHGGRAPRQRRCHRTRFSMCPPQWTNHNRMAIALSPPQNEILTSSAVVGCQGRRRERLSPLHKGLSLYRGHQRQGHRFRRPRARSGMDRHLQGISGCIHVSGTRVMHDSVLR